MVSVCFSFCFYQRPETFLHPLASWLCGHLETLGVSGGRCLPPVGLLYYNICKISFQFQFYENSTGGSCYRYPVICFRLHLGSFTEAENCALTTWLRVWWRQRHILCTLFLARKNHILGCAISEGQSVFISSEFFLDFTSFFFPCVWLCPFPWPTMLLLPPPYGSLRETLQKCRGWPVCDERKSEVSGPRRALLPLLWP